MKIYNQSGRSMIEMLGVLAIVGVLSAGGIAGYSMAMQSYRTNQFIEKMQLMMQQTRALYKGKYDGVNGTQPLIDSGKITDNKNPFGGTLDLINSGSNIFKIETSDTNVPAEACVDIVTAYWGESGMFSGITIDGVVYATYENGSYPIKLSDAINYCKGDNKKIRFFAR